NLGRHVTEIAQTGRARRNERPGHRQVGRQLVFAVAFLVAVHNSVDEIVYVQDGQTHSRIRLVDQRAVAVVVKRIAGVGLIHQASFFFDGGHDRKLPTESSVRQNERREQSLRGADSILPHAQFTTYGP